MVVFVGTAASKVMLDSRLALVYLYVFYMMIAIIG